MDTPKRRLALSKRVSLAHLFDGNEGCYALVRPATRAEYKHMTSEKMINLERDEEIKVQNKFVRDHFVSGKVLALDDNNNPVLADMVADDVDEQVHISNALYIKIMGFNLDPKDL